MYSDDAQNNPLLLTSLLVEALANSNNGVANQTLNATEQSPTSLQASTAQFLQANGLANNFLPTTPISLSLPAQFSTPQISLAQIFNPAPPAPTISSLEPLLLNQNALSQMLLLNSALQQDILRLSHDTDTCHLKDDGSESSRSATAAPPQIPVTNPSLNAFESPLDLTMRKLPTHLEEEPQPSTSSLRPTVIKNSFPLKPPRLEPTTRSCGVKRSTSSLSYRSAPDPDVSDHFRRSLSGKWPRRPANYSHYTINNSNRLDSTPASQQSTSAASTRVTSPTIPRRTITGGSNTCLSQMIIGGGEVPVEEHFRRTFELLRQNAEKNNEPHISPASSTRL